MKSISLLGYGWLGKPLATTLLQRYPHINISTRSSCKPPQSQLIHSIIDLPLIIDPQFFKCTTLIITIPFKRNLGNPSDYFKAIDSIIPFLNGINQIIFTSSTMIYETKNTTVTENSPINQTPRSQILNQVEQRLLSQPNIKTTILRLGGLFGPQREIGQFAIQKKTIMADHPINFIHQNDVILIIQKLLKTPYHGILNAVSDNHPTRKKLYQKYLTQDQLSQVNFIHDETMPYKIVDSTKLKKLLQFKFNHNL